VHQARGSPSVAGLLVGCDRDDAFWKRLDDGNARQEALQILLKENRWNDAMGKDFEDDTLTEQALQILLEIAGSAL
jgi:hypothetical protein